MWTLCKKFQNFWMNNEDVMNFARLVNNWSKHEQKAWKNGQTRLTDGNVVNSASLIQNSAFWHGERNVLIGWWPMEQYRGQWTFKILGLKTLGFMQQGNGNQQHQTRFDQAIITVWHWNTSCNIKQPWTKHNKHNSCGFSGHSSRV